MVSGSRPGLSASHEGQYHAAASRRRTADPGNCRVDTRRHCKRGALRDRCLLRHRRAPRRRSQGTMDHRHERSPVRIQGSRLWDAPEHRGNVLRLQNPGLGITRSRIDWSGSYRFRQSLCTGPFQPGQKKNTLSRNAAKKGGPESSTILCSLFRAGLRTIRRSLAGFAKIHKLREVWIN